MNTYQFYRNTLATTMLTSVLGATVGQTAPGSFTDVVTIEDSLTPATTLFLDNTNLSFPAQLWAVNNLEALDDSFVISDCGSDDCLTTTFPFIIAKGAPTASILTNGLGRVALGGAVTNPAINPALTVGLDGFGGSSIGMPNGTDEWFLASFGGGFGIVNLDASVQPLSLTADGDVGVGFITNPAATLHVGNLATAQVLVENFETADTGSARIMFDLNNASQDRIRFALTAPGGKRWTFDNTPASDTFGISKFGTGKTEFLVNNAGDGKFLRNSIAVNHINTSSRASKADFSSVDSRDILARLTALPVSRWRYKAEGPRQRHIGPVAEDFKQVFNLGDGKTISTVDASGIAFAAIKGLKEEKDAEIAQVKAERDLELADRDEEIAALKGQMLQLEMMLAELLRKRSSDLDISAVTH